MDITTTALFSSSGGLSWGFDKTTWENQFGNGFSFELSFKWISFTIEFYFGDPDETQSGE